jgi:4a-hydroxytetrahydrobiopterin dehydratase
MPKLTDTEVTERLDSLAGWTREGDMIGKTFKLPTFPAAIAFITHVAFLAEAVNHHPDMDIRYNKVLIGLTTHDVGGLSEKDFDLAAQIDDVMV